jgi:catechol 2,3-dioxygenase-like lactoylglutathione lyase family enzyme
MPEIMTAPDAEERSFRIKMMFHPNYHVADLRETERWFERVFGSTSTSMEAMLAGASGNTSRFPAGYPTDYATFTVIRDVLIESMDPKRLVMHGVQRYKTVDTPHLKNLGWYVDRPIELYHALKRHGFGVAEPSGEAAAGEEPPMPAFFSIPDETGIRYQFWGGRPLAIDPRPGPGWTLPPVSDDDPLGIERCSHHTILTGRPERALKLVVDVLGGRVIHEGPNGPRATKSSTYVDIGGSILEYGVPEEGTPTHEDWSTGDTSDTYHAITWKVIDLERSERHLANHGVRIGARTGDIIITDPATSLGVPWGFTTKLTPGDPRSSD